MALAMEVGTCLASKGKTACSNAGLLTAYCPTTGPLC